MKKFKCTVCAYECEGNQAPDKCPVCAAPASVFEVIGGEKKGGIFSDKNSNAYIITYATIMVVLVASVLSFAALSLKGIQAENVRIEKMSDIIRSVGQADSLDNVSDKTAYILAQYDKYITDSYAVSVTGQQLEGVDAFTLLINLKAEYDKAPADRRLPVFVSKDDEGVVSYVVPVWGTGLWGPVWGYVALAEDWDTILGVVFDHKSETPGLGAEIATPAFQAQFDGKKILNGEGQVVAVALVKGGAQPDDEHGVDALTGGTLTSRGVEDMLKNCLGDYASYIDIERAQLLTPALEDTLSVEPADSLTLK